MQVFDATAVRERSPLPALVQALARAFAAGAEVPQRHVHALPGGAGMLLMPAWRGANARADVSADTGMSAGMGGSAGGGAGDSGAPAAARGRLGVKTVTVYPGNGALGLPGVHGLYSLFDLATGVPLAVLDGSELTARRTVAASALAASHLARADATRLLVVGAGRVAALLPEAMRAVRPGLADIAVWARRPEAARSLAAAWRAQGLPAAATTALEAAVRRADIVSCATLAAEPLVRGAWLRPGTHLDLIGAFTPTMREADAACFARASVWVDTPEAAAKAGDLLGAVAEGAFAVERIVGGLAELSRNTCRGRTSEDQCTLFKSVGNALEDLAAAELVLDGPAL